MLTNKNKSPMRGDKTFFFIGISATKKLRKIKRFQVWVTKGTKNTVHCTAPPPPPGGWMGYFSVRFPPCVFETENCAKIDKISQKCFYLRLKNRHTFTVYKTLNHQY